MNPKLNMLINNLFEHQQTDLNKKKSEVLRSRLFSYALFLQRNLYKLFYNELTLHHAIMSGKTT